MNISNALSMPTDSQDAPEAFILHQQPMGTCTAYLAALTNQYSGMLNLKTGSGHIFFDLVNALPDIPRHEEAKIKLCRMVADVVYPLAARLFAQGVAVQIHIAPHTLYAPEIIRDMGIYAAFDLPQETMTHCFLSPDREVLAPAELTVKSGMTVLCTPFNYQYHQLKHQDGAEGYLDNLPRNAGSTAPSADWANRSIDRPSTTPERSLSARALGLNYNHEIGKKEHGRNFVPEAKHEAAPVAPAAEAPRYILPAVAGASGAAHAMVYGLEPWAQKYWRHKLELSHAGEHPVAAPHINANAAPVAQPAHHAHGLASPSPFPGSDWTQKE